MIKYLFIAVVLLAACNRPSTQEHQHNTQATKESTVGRKVGRWQLDAATRENVNDLRMILTGPGTSKDLKEVTASLEAKTDELVRECTMKGPDHDALHVWLEGYVGHLKELKKNNSPEFYDSLQHDLVVLDKRFE